jgi:4-amino-4-deoxy-L-arabinose transferase-like glycosyltransferase
MKNKFQLLIYIFFAVIFAALVFRNIQLSHVPLQDWDESIYARVAYESAKDKHWSMTYNNQLWLEKPPLLVYLLSGIMMLFGQSEFWLRSISILFGMAVLICLYLLSQKIAKAMFKKDTPYLPLVSILPVLIVLSTQLFVERTTYVDYDMPLALGWLFFFLADTFNIQLIALLIGVLSKSLLGFFPFVFDILYFRKMNRPVWQWIALLLIPLVWHFISLAVYGETFVQMHIVDHLLKRVSDPIELHFGGRTFYVKELISQFSILLIVIGGGYIALTISFVKKFLKKKMFPDHETIILLSPLAYLAFLTISKTKIPWYIMPTLPLLSLTVVYLFYSVQNKWFRIVLSVFIIAFFCYKFSSFTVLFKPDTTVKDKDKVAMCIQKLPQSTVAMLVDEDERKIKNVFDAAHLGISSSFIYGGSPALVYYSRKKVDFYYDVKEFTKKAQNYKIVIVKKNDEASIENINKTPACASGDWKSFTIESSR